MVDAHNQTFHPQNRRRPNRPGGVPLTPPDGGMNPIRPGLTPPQSAGIENAYQGPGTPMQAPLQTPMQTPNQRPIQGQNTQGQNTPQGRQMPGGAPINPINPRLNNAHQGPGPMPAGRVPTPVPPRRANPHSFNHAPTNRPNTPPNIPVSPTPEGLAPKPQPAQPQVPQRFSTQAPNMPNMPNMQRAVHTPNQTHASQAQPVQAQTQPQPTQTQAPQPQTTPPQTTLPQEIPSQDSLPEIETTPAPVEPPSQLKYHLMGIASGLILTPIGILLTVWGIMSIMNSPTGQSALGPMLIGLGFMLVGFVFQLGTGYVCGYYSSLSLAVGAIWPMLITILASPLRKAVTTHNDQAQHADSQSLIWTLLSKLSTLTSSGLFPTMAIILVAAAIASQTAYRYGQEAAVEERQLATTSDKELNAPKTPRSRLRDHIIASVSSIALTIAGLLCLIPLHDRLALVTGGAAHALELPTALQLILPIIGISLLFLAVATGSRSAAGVLLAGITVGIIPGFVLMVGEVSSSFWAEALIGWLSKNLTSSMHVSGGPLFSMGLILVACGLTLYWCRKAGRRDKLADLLTT